MDHFNELSPGEHERLSLLLEELGEAIQVVGKIMRHGYESHYPGSSMTNRQDLEHELGDVRHAMILLCSSGDLSKEAVHSAAESKALRVGRYLHHQGKDHGQ